MNSSQESNLEKLHRSTQKIRSVYLIELVPANMLPCLLILLLFEIRFSHLLQHAEVEVGVDENEQVLGDTVAPQFLVVCKRLSTLIASD